MAYEEMKCRKCGKPIQFAEGAPWIRCVYCGAEYTRTAKKEKAGEVQPIGNGGNPLPHRNKDGQRGQPLYG